MGGTNSGGWNAKGRPLISQMLRLDLAGLARAGMLRDGASGTLRWSRGEKVFAAIAIEGGRHWVRLRFTATDRLGASEQVTQHVAVLWSPCRFGGERPFWVCPRCTRRALALYGGARFLCRGCHRATYPSQRERSSDRAQRRGDRLRARLGGDAGWGEVPPRPKGMWRRTYDRIVEHIEDADAVIDVELIRVAARLDPSFRRSLGW